MHVLKLTLIHYYVLYISYVVFLILGNALEAPDGTNQEENLKLQTTSSIETEVEDEFENLLIFKENENEDADTVIQFENLPDDAKV